MNCLALALSLGSTLSSLALQARKVLGGLKDKSDPEDLPVYPVDIRGNKVFVKFVK